MGVFGFFSRKKPVNRDDTREKNSKLKSSSGTHTRSSSTEEKRGEVIIHQPPWKVPTIHDKVSAFGWRE
jgi:hypothetical protein